MISFEQIHNLIIFPLPEGDGPLLTRERYFFRHVQGILDIRDPPSESGLPVSFLKEFLTDHREISGNRLL